MSHLFLLKILLVAQKREEADKITNRYPGRTRPFPVEQQKKTGDGGYI